MNSENYGFMIGFGIIGFLSFLFTRLFPEDLGFSQDQLNMLGIMGGVGLVLMIYGFYMLIKTNPIQERILPKLDESEFITFKEWRQSISQSNKDVGVNQ